MTRKDYVLLAQAIRGSFAAVKNAEQQNGVKTAAERLSDALAADNPRFDRTRFLEAAIPAFIRGEAA